MNTKVVKRGASSSRLSHSDKFESWYEHHQLVAAESLQRLLATPVATFLTMAVIAIALALPSALYVLIHNAENVTEQWGGNAQISLFMNDRISDDEANSISRQLGQRPDVARTQFISREQALNEFRENSGLGDALRELPGNPLPAVVVVYPKDTSPAAAEKLRDEMAKVMGVETAQLDTEWLKRLHAMLAVGKRILFMLGLALALGVVLVIVNTIRLAIENRRDEIFITKLVGATDAYVRRPFLYTGLFYGATSGLLAIFLVEIGLLWLSPPVTELAGLYGSSYQLTGLGFSGFLIILISA
ncbi:MAG TPA: permease-like cell division protein FtsX, partial [Pseudomonadales bacterium]|nr:permease-like cell division protein FtsX [Pseudomonadales bacterium]